MKFFLIYCLILCGLTSTAQIGVNTTTPQGTLDVVTTNNTGLILPRVDSIKNVTDGVGGPPLNGTTVYDVSRSATCFYQNDSWTCIDRDASGNPILVDVSATFDNCAYIKASNTDAGDFFGTSVALSDDGNTLAVGAFFEENFFSGINGDQSNNGALNSGAVYVFTRTGDVWSQEAYVKASNTGAGDFFGRTVSLSGDGNTLAVGAVLEDSNAVGVNGDQTNNSFQNSGAVYVFRRDAGVWTQEAYVKSSNTEANDDFGRFFSLSGDGGTLVVGAPLEDSNSVGINGDQIDNSSQNSGAVYVFTRVGGIWSQEAYLKASNVGVSDGFGSSLSLSNDGSLLAVGARNEDSNSAGINGDESNNSSQNSGAVYVFTRVGGVWSQEAYIKALNPGVDDFFGRSISLSGDGNTLAVGAEREDSNATGVDGDQADNSASNSGAVYVFARAGGVWSQEAYVKASNTESGDGFGFSVSLSDDGNKLAVGAPDEDSNTTVINGDEADNSAVDSGAAYVFSKAGGVWCQVAYVKASNTESVDLFGRTVSLSGSGITLAVGAPEEDSNAVGVNGDQTNNSALDSGAVFVCDH